jgi:hypothetical protein
LYSNVEITYIKKLPVDFRHIRHMPSERPRAVLEKHLLGAQTSVEKRETEYMECALPLLLQTHMHGRSAG